MKSRKELSRGQLIRLIDRSYKAGLEQSGLVSQVDKELKRFGLFTGRVRKKDVKK